MSKNQLFFDLFFSLNIIFTMINRLRKVKKPGNQTWSENAGLLFPTKMPATAKIKTNTMAMMTIQQVRVESYQGVMAFRKNGF